MPSETLGDILADALNANRLVVGNTYLDGDGFAALILEKQMNGQFKARRALDLKTLNEGGGIEVVYREDGKFGSGGNPHWGNDLQFPAVNSRSKSIQIGESYKDGDGYVVRIAYFDEPTGFYVGVVAPRNNEGTPFPRFYFENGAFQDGNWISDNLIVEPLRRPAWEAYDKLDSDVRRLIEDNFHKTGHKITTIRMIRSLTNMGLKDGKELVESWVPPSDKQRFDDLPMHQREEIWHFRNNNQKINAIKRIRELLGIGLTEAKRLYEEHIQ